MKSIYVLQREVGEWSQANFGGQETNRLSLVVDDTTPTDFNAGEWDWKVLLGSLAPLMGIAEEIGELASSTNPVEEEDAIGDIMIYLLDYSHREGLELAGLWPNWDNPNGERTPCPLGSLYPIVKAMGMLFHATLKHHQGIRGMDDLDAYRQARNQAVEELVRSLMVFASHGGQDLIVIVNKTWETVVSKRDWKADPNPEPQEEKVAHCMKCGWEVPWNSSAGLLVTHGMDCPDCNATGAIVIR